ncbi:MAG: DnaJ domain-containing protein [Demequinaceae bacterium]|nr:DnaJ domain-containing protein [Demequinaceae bacterium]
MTSQDWFNKDFYATLGVSREADDTAIKKAYRKLARQLHPDAKPGDTKAEARFKEVGEAYAVLSDPEQRRQYDAIRAMGGGARFSAGGAGFEDAFAGMFRGGRRTGRGGVEDMLGNLFGGGYSMGPIPGSDIAAAVEVSFRQAAEGATVTLDVGGRNVATRLPVGVRDGQRIRVRGKGQASRNGGPAGDLVLTVHVSEHPVFKADGTNLRVRLPVSFAEATLGAEVEVPTLDGNRVKVKIPAGTSSGTTLRVKGRGLQAKSGTGDLLATVEVRVPSKLSPKAREALGALADETADSTIRADLYKAASQ